MINESLDVIRHMRASVDIHIIKDFRKIPQIKGNRTELQQIFVNLFDNAADAMNNKGILDITTRTNNGSLEIIINDNGIGIQSDDLNQIFEPFFTTKEGENGTGLGLFITSLIVKKHNGKIAVESEMGKGTTFTVAFPISQEIK